jgi:hypothetical protein
MFTSPLRSIANAFFITKQAKVPQEALMELFHTRCGKHYLCYNPQIMASTCENRYEVITRELNTLIRLHPRGYFEIKQNFEQSGWEPLVDQEDNLKIVLIHRDLGLFVKMFAPQTHDFAIRTNRALEKISLINDLSVPPLLPIAFCNTTFIFPLGEPKGSIDDHRYKEIYYVINPIAEQERLKLAGHFDLIEIQGREYMADIFEDKGSDLTS